MVLKRGEKKFSVFVGKQEKSPEETGEQWTAAVGEWNNGPEEDRQYLYQNSSVFTQRVALITALERHGIALPVNLN